MKREEKITRDLAEYFEDNESLSKYIEQLNFRISENRKAAFQLSLLLVILIIAFPLLLQTKIAEVSIGPVKIIDNVIIIKLIPTFLSFVYYKYLTLWNKFAEQKETYNLATAKLFGIKKDSSLNEQLTPFSIANTLDVFVNKPIGKLGCLYLLLLIPGILIIGLAPIVLQVYFLKFLIDNYEIQTIFDWSSILIPSFIIILMIGWFVFKVKDEVGDKSSEANEKLQ